MTRAAGSLARAVLGIAAVVLALVSGADARASARGTTTTAAASSLRVVDAAAPEIRTNGKIFAFDPFEGAYSCSGTALNTPSRSIVLTAGHCVVEGGGRGRDLVFVPAFDHGSRPFGTFVVTATYVMPQWKDKENPDYDVAALRVRPNRLGRLGDVVGMRDWVTGKSRFARFQIFGYPAGALEGQALRSCNAKGLGSDVFTNRFHGPPTVPGRCNMAGGASGGGWLLNGRVNGVTSYGYTHRLGRLYSPYFGPAVGAFLAALP
jgi:hypothetical protein